jgi:hypothetical protein
MIATLHVLSIGSPESNGFVNESLLSRTNCRLFAATCVWELSAFLTSGTIDVAILHNSLSAGELRSCAIYTRRHWPNARILLIHEGVEILDDPMYDERMLPDSSAETLLAMIEWLAAGSRRVTMRMPSNERTQISVRTLE